MNTEKTSGTILGAISGVASSMNGLDIMITLLIAFVTGLLGAAGAHLFKMIVMRISKKEIKDDE
jgi:hypothetical protein